MKKFIVLLLIWITSISIFSKTIELKVALNNDSGNMYYLELLERSFELIEDDLVLSYSGTLPQKRVIDLFNRGIIDIFWLVESEERNRKYTLIDVELTNSLIGKRILFIKKGEQSQFDNVSNIEDFRSINKVGGFGKNWFDVNVWKENDLKYFEEPGDWSSLYKIVGYGGRGVDYFSRGLNEILVEYESHKNYLDIEENLVFIYERDFKYYLNKENASYKKTIEKALKKAEETGLIEEMVRKYWKEDLEKLNYDARTKIFLKTPR